MLPPTWQQCKCVGEFVCAGETQVADDPSLQLQEAEDDGSFEESAADSSTYEAEEEPTFEENEDAEAGSDLQGSGDVAGVPNRAQTHAPLPFKAPKGMYTTGSSIWHFLCYCNSRVLRPACVCQMLVGICVEYP